MVSPVGNKIWLNSRHERTSQDPMGIGLNYSLDSRYEAHVGYLMPGYRRPMSMMGVRNEVMFWDYCKDCSLYKQRQCTGGFRVLASTPGADSIDYRSSTGNAAKYYNREFCRMHYGTEKLRRDLNTPGTVIANLEPHFFMIKERNIYWYLFRVNEETRDVELLPYQLFNTYDTGQICYGGDASNFYSMPQRYESFFNARMNTDLMPFSMALPDWVRTFDADKLDRKHKRRNSPGWASQARHLSGTTFEVVPPLYDLCVFASVTGSTIPEEIPLEQRDGNKTLAFLRTSGDPTRWYCSKNLGYEITQENWPTVYNFLSRQ